MRKIKKILIQVACVLGVSFAVFADDPPGYHRVEGSIGAYEWVGTSGSSNGTTGSSSGSSSGSSYTNQSATSGASGGHDSSCYEQAQAEEHKKQQTIEQEKKDIANATGTIQEYLSLPEAQNVTDAYSSEIEKNKSTEEKRRESFFKVIHTVSGEKKKAEQIAFGLKTDVDAPSTEGDPVLLALGAYYTESEDTSFRYGKNTYTFFRTMTSGVHPQGCLGTTWNSCLDTRIIRGVDKDAGAKANMIMQKYNDYARATSCLFNIKYETQNLNSLIQRRMALGEKLLGNGNFFRQIAQRSATNEELNTYVTYGSYADDLKIGVDTLVYVDESGTARIFSFNATTNKYEPYDKTVCKNCYITSSGYSGGFIVHDGDGVEKGFNKWGKISYISDAYGSRIDFVYGAKQQLETITHHGKPMLEFSWNENGCITRIHNYFTESTITYAYENKNLIQYMDEQKDFYAYVYDASGDLIKMIKPDATVITIEYGNQKQNETRALKKIVTATMNEESKRETFLYDEKANKLYYTDADGNATVYTYGSNSEILREDHADKTFVTRTYDKKGNVLQRTDNFGTVSYAYDENGNILSARYGDGTTETWLYDAQYQNVLSYKDRDGVVTTYAYNAKGTCTTISRSGKNILTATINGWGGIATVEGISGKKIYSYDDKYNVVETESGRYAYDEKNRVSSYTDRSENKWTYSYSEDGKITETVTPLKLYVRVETNNRKDVARVVQTDEKTNESEVTKYVYDGRHLVTKVFMGSGDSEEQAEQSCNCVETCAYSDAGLLIKDTLWNFAAAAIHDAPGICTEYEYNGENRIASVKKYYVDRNFVQQGNSYKTTYAYSFENGRLKVAVKKGTAPATYEYYDCYGNGVNFIDGSGRKNTYEYSAAGRLLASVNILGGKTSYSYNRAFNEIASETRGSRIVSKYEYDNNGRLVQETKVDGTKVMYTYAEENGTHVVTVHSPAKSVTTVYDSMGRMIKYEILSDKHAPVLTQTFIYQDDGRTCIVKNGTAQVTQKLDAWKNVVYSSKTNETATYTADGKILRTKKKCNAEDVVTSYSYTATGQLSEKIASDGHIDSYCYNALGLLIKHSDAEGVVWQGEYTDGGKLLWETGRLIPYTTYRYDAGGLLVEKKEAGCTVETYVYADDMKSVSVKDARGNTIRLEYDSYGNNTSVTNRIGKVLHVQYDDENNTKIYTGYSGEVTKIIRSASENTLEKVYQDGTSQKIYFDSADAIIALKDKTIPITYTYDNMHLLTQINSGDAKIKYAYDSQGRKSAIISDNVTDTYEYDETGNVIRASCNGHIMSFAYDCSGRQILSTDENGVTVERVYDKANRIILVVQKDKQGKVLFGTATVYDDNGRVDATIDNEARVTKYEYDERGRLVCINLPYIQNYEDDERNALELIGEKIQFSASKKITLSESCTSKLGKLLYMMNKTAHVPTTQSWWYEQYAYDENDNRLSKQTMLGTMTYEYDAENRLVKMGTVQPVNFVYDDNGNLIERRDSKSTTKYTYSLENRIVSSTVADAKGVVTSQKTYSYDVLGRRTSERDFDGMQVDTLYDGYSFNKLSDCTMQNAPLQNNVVAVQSVRYRNVEEAPKRAKTIAGEPVCYLKVNGLLQYQVSGNDATSFCTDANGTVIAAAYSGTLGKKSFAMQYDGSGIPYVKASDSPNNWNDSSKMLLYKINTFFCGKQVDSSKMWYNFGYRDYDSTTARFTTLDPICAGLNWYVYCNSDPVNFFDPDGLDVKSVGNAKQTDSNKPLGNGTETIAAVGCVLTSYYRIAQELGYTGSLSDANDVGKENNYFTKGGDSVENCLSPKDGCALINKLASDCDKNVEFVETVEGSKETITKTLENLQNSKTEYYVTVRIATENADKSEQYEHTMSVNNNPVYELESPDKKEKTKEFHYNDTSNANRNGTADTTRKNILKKIDVFKVVPNCTK